MGTCNMAGGVFAKKHQVRIDVKGIKQLFIPILVRCECKWKYIHALFSVPGP